MNWRWLEHTDLGISVDLRGMALPDDLPLRSGPLLRRAVDEMRELEAGAVANADEGRQVGHYWLRAPHLAPAASQAAAIEAMQRSVAGFVESLAGRFPTVLAVGIGGSALGPQLIADALGGPDDARRGVFLDNTDPDGMTRTIAGLDLGETLVVVTSKSGGTAETRNGLLVVRDAYLRAGLDFACHAVAITGAGSRLDADAAEAGWLARFPMWDWVGGRTSVLAAVGLVPAALQGLDTAGLLRGAAEMDAWTRQPEATENPALMLALAWHHASGGAGLRANVVLPYRDRLALLARYLQQLVMESIGKALDRSGREVHQGLTVYGNKGSTDQHAYVQQLREGPDDHFVSFVEVLADAPGPAATLEVDDGVNAGDFLAGFLAGTRAALRDVGRRTLTLTLGTLDARRLGALIALHERAVGYYASLVDVNAYHQPGVEAGKLAAQAVLELQRRLQAELAAGPGGTARELAAAVGGAEDDTFRVLRRLAATGRCRESGDGLERFFAGR